MAGIGSVVVIAAPRVVEIREESVASPGEGEVLIRAVRSLISTGTEMTAYTGDFPREKSAWASYIRYPFRTGYSHIGEVVEVGPGVESVRVGSRVFSHAVHASLVVQKSQAVVPLPDGVSPEFAALSAVSAIAMNGVRMAEIALGEAVIVVGLGIVGQMALRFASLNGAYPLIALDISEERLATARAAGATHTINSRLVDPLEAVLAFTRGRKADVVFEVTGNPAVIPSLPPLLRRAGRLVLLGSPRGKTSIDLHDEVHTFGLRVIGAHASNHPLVETPGNVWTRPRNVELYLDLLGAGLVDASSLITHRFSWRQAAEVFRLLDEDRTRTLGVILNWEQDL